MGFVSLAPSRHRAAPPAHGQQPPCWEHWMGTGSPPCDRPGAAGDGDIRQQFPSPVRLSQWLRRGEDLRSWGRLQPLWSASGASGDAGARVRCEEGPDSSRLQGSLGGIAPAPGGLCSPPSSCVPGAAACHHAGRWQRWHAAVGGGKGRDGALCSPPGEENFLPVRNGRARDGGVCRGFGSQGFQPLRRTGKVSWDNFGWWSDSAS